MLCQNKGNARLRVLFRPRRLTQTNVGGGGGRRAILRKRIFHFSRPTNVRFALLYARVCTVRSPILKYIEYNVHRLSTATRARNSINRRSQHLFKHPSDNGAKEFIWGGIYALVVQYIARRACIGPCAAATLFTLCYFPHDNIVQNNSYYRCNRDNIKYSCIEN